MSDDEQLALHNQITAAFIMSLHPVLKQKSKRKSLGGMMVIIETVQLGIMAILKEGFGMKPGDCAEMMESCLHQALQRFAEANRKETKQ